MTDNIAPQTKSIPSLNDAARQNVDTGVLLLCKEALITAIQDRRLKRGHLSVLAAMATFLNGQTAKAWPSRQAIAVMCGMDADSVTTRLFELRKFGYLIAGRERVVAAGNRSLTVYTFGNVDHETIRREIGQFVEELKARGRKEPEEDLPPPVGSKRNLLPPVGSYLPPAVGPERNLPPAVSPNLLPVVDSNSSKEEEKKVSAAAAPQSLKDLCWKQAYGWILSQYPEIDPARTRSRFGGLYTKYGAGQLLDAVFKAQQMTAVDPLDYITKILNTTKTGKASSAAARQIEAMK